MPSREEVHYFGAGPAPLPTEILSQVGDVMLNYNNLGFGICEMSHRSSEANQVLASAKAALATLLDIPTDEYEILFSQGGGTGQFSAVVYHMVALWLARRKEAVERELGGGKELADDQDVVSRLRDLVQKELKLDYLVTGSWSLKASQEAARLVGKTHVNVATDSRTIAGRDGKFGSIAPEHEWALSPSHQSAMVYYCDNETVDGVEFPSFPARLVPGQGETSTSSDYPLVVCDMSSNFISRKVNVRNYAVIFGGAQKNVGVTGLTITIVRKSVLTGQTASPDLLRAVGLPVGPITYDWNTTAKNNSLYNTLPIFDVWVAGQVMENLVAHLGPAGLKKQEEIVAHKAGSIYSALERYPSVYQIVPATEVRSRMNICFRILAPDVPAAEKKFVQGGERLGLLGIKGHRSVGGMRISNYNAVPVEATEKLANYLHHFAQNLGE